MESSALGLSVSTHHQREILVAMPESNVDVVRRGYEAFNRRDFEAMLDLVGDSVTWRPFFSVEQGVLRGKDGLRALWKSQVVTLDLKVEPREIIAVGDTQVLAVARWIGRGARSGTPVDATNAQVLTLENGRVVHFETYTSKDEALKATQPHD